MTPLPYLMMCFSPSLPCASPVINIARGVWSYGLMLITLSPNATLSVPHIPETRLFIHSLFIHLFSFILFYYFLLQRKPPWQQVHSLRLCLLFCLAVGCSLERGGGEQGCVCSSQRRSHRHGSVAPQHASLFTCPASSVDVWGQGRGQSSRTGCGFRLFVSDTLT